MDIFYTNETLYVNMNKINNSELNLMQKKVFRIIEDYDIDNVVLKVPKIYDRNSDLFSPFVSAYRKKHNGNLKIM